jgi:hypothetical protein
MNHDDPKERHDWLVDWEYKEYSGTITLKDCRADELSCDGEEQCDCYKADRLSTILTVRKCPELYNIEGENYLDGSGPVDETHARCGSSIKYSNITKIEY